MNRRNPTKLRVAANRDKTANRPMNVKATNSLVTKAAPEEEESGNC